MKVPVLEIEGSANLFSKPQIYNYLPKMSILNGSSRLHSQFSRIFPALPLFFNDLHNIFEFEMIKLEIFL